VNSFKILAFIPIWKRPEITRQCLEGIKALGLDMFCVVSEDWAEDMAKEFGAEYVRTENKPVGRKFNKGLEGVLMLAKDYDYLMTFNSDTLINPKLLKVYDYYMNEGIDLIGVDKVYFIEDKKAKFVDYKLQIIGAARLISFKSLRKIAKRIKVKFLNSIAGSLNGNVGEERFINKTQARMGAKSGFLEIIGEERVMLWDDSLNSTLDNSSNRKLIYEGASNKCIDVGKYPYVIDLKSDVNIWQFDSIEGEVANYNYVMSCLVED